MRDVPAETLDVVGLFMKSCPDCQKTRHVGQLRRPCSRVSIRSNCGRLATAPRLLLPASVMGKRD